MAEASFSITYDGPALDSGRMEVRELAPALVALAELIQEANAIAYPQGPPVTLHIEATNEGSFEVVLSIVQQGWHQVVSVFSGDDATTLVNLKELVLGGFGLFALIKRLRGRRIVRQEGQASGSITITLDGGETITLPAEVLRVYGSITVRRRARAVIEPVSRDGVDVLRLRRDVDSEVTVEIGKQDAPSFTVRATEEPMGENRLTLSLAVMSVALDGNKWRLSDGQATHYVTMADEAFLARIDAGEPFRKGDILTCDVHIVQTRGESGLTSDWTVRQVLDHVPAVPEPSLFDLVGRDEDDSYSPDPGEED